MRKIKRFKCKGLIVATIAFLVSLFGHYNINATYNYSDLITTSSTVAHICQYEDDMILNLDAVNLFFKFCDNCGNVMNGSDGFIYTDNYCEFCNEVKVIGNKYCPDCGDELVEKQRIKLSETKIKTIDKYRELKIAIIITRVLIVVSGFYIAFSIPNLMDNTVNKKKKR